MFFDIKTVEINIKSLLSYV